MSRRIIFILVFFLCIISVVSRNNKPVLSENAKVSLLTCSPNTDAIYALFGHTAIRISDETIGVDLVFDYGIFDFDSDNFIFRFVKGETDYIVAPRPFGRFLFEYNYRESGLNEQDLNLTLSEKQAICDALITNSQMENRTYRYNFLKDNCSTRLRDIIVSNVDGKVIFQPSAQDQTYRDLLEECLVVTPWSRFGINLVIGSAADTIITDRQKDFIPHYLHEALNQATVISVDGNSMMLISEDRVILEPDTGALELQEAMSRGLKVTNYPLFIGVIILIIAIGISYLSYEKNRVVYAKIFDTLLFFTAGLAGCIIFFLMFFSEHPCVGANWNLIWLNPIELLIIPFFFFKSCSKCVFYYHFVNFALLILFLVFLPFIPQSIDFAFVPYVLILLTRSGENVLKYRKLKMKSQKINRR